MLHVFGQWEVTIIPGENLHTHTHTQAKDWESNQQTGVLPHLTLGYISI